MPPRQQGKRSRSTSRSRSPKRRTTSIQECAEMTAAPRSVGEWSLMHDRSIMALPPTTAMLEPVIVSAAQRLARSISNGGQWPLRLRVAAFDMDDTLIAYRRSTAARKKNAGSAVEGEWEWLHPSVPGHLRQLAAHGYLLALFSNQSGINGSKAGWNAAKATAIQEKIIALSRALALPLVAYVSTKYDGRRKPLPAMWGELQEHATQAALGLVASGQSMDCSGDSFFVGDAAGRPAGPGRPKKDFSCADRRFAHNLSLPFYTPDQFFGAFPNSEALCDGTGLSVAFLSATAKVQSVPFDWGGMSPDALAAIPASYSGLQAEMLTVAGATPITLPSQPPYFLPPAARQEMVVLVGPPSTGKSTAYARHWQLHGYARVNRDTLGTKEKCLKEAERLWRSGRGVVVDNTNPTRADRRLYVDLVRRLLGVAPATLPVRFVVLAYSRELAMHLNRMRARLNQAAPLPDVAFHTFYARYEAVTPEELQSTGVESALVLPPVISFEGLHPLAKREFFMLS